MLKKILIGVAALLILLAVGAGVLLARFDPNQYRDTLAALVKEKTQRTLQIDGDIKLALFPNLGVEIGKTSLSEHQGTARFASIERARLSVAVLPLLSKQVVVDKVVVEGLTANLSRDKTGKTNFDDLIQAGPKTQETSPDKQGQPDRQGSPVGFDIAGISLANTRLNWRDEAAGQAITLDKLNLKTGRVAPGQPLELDLSTDVQSSQPKAAVHVALKGTVLADPAAQRHGVTGLDLKVEGAALGLSGLKVAARGDARADLKEQRLETKGLTLTVSATQGGAPLELQLAAPRLNVSKTEASGDPITGSVKLAGANPVELKFNASAPSGNAQALRIAKLALDFKATQGARTTSGTLTTPLAANLEQKILDLPALAADLQINDPALPNKTLRVPVSAKVHVDLGKDSVSLADLVAKLDDSTLRGRVGVSGFGAPALDFDLALDQINVDNYLPPAAAPAAGQAAAATGPEKPIDLTALQSLNLRGTLKVGKLQVHKLKLADLALTTRAADGRLDVSSISANLYQGTLAGSAVVSARHQFAVRQTLSNVALGPLLKDAIAQDMLEGRGTIALDLTAAGQTVTAIKSALGGSAKVQLRDGAIKGINLAESLRNFQSMIGLKKNQTQNADQNARTDFSEMSASFTLNNGVASNRDLQAKSPFFRLSGQGDVDIGKSRIDYLLRAMVVNTSTGQDGKSLAQLKDVTVPVRIVGPFDKLGYEIQWAAISSDVLKNSVKDKLLDKLGGGNSNAGNTGNTQPVKPADALKQRLLKGLGR